ncbi:MAG: lactate racemase domain-containing protein, partial [Candidatus Thorarchaeota archaeon]
MKVELLYKGVQKLVTIPDSHRVESVRPRTVDVHVTDEKLVLNAIGAPIDSVSLQDFISSYKSFLIIVNDHARPTPTPKIIKVLLPFLENKEFKI